MRKITVSVPATSANLGPGFDCLGLSLDLRNVFEISPSFVEKIQILGHGQDIARFQSDNMFVRIFLQSLGLTTQTDKKFSFTFTNNIPISRGLGSSSSIILGALAASYLHQNKEIQKYEILDNALRYESHPDNLTPAVFGGFCVAVLENNKVIHARFDISSEIRAIVVVPNRATSTKKSRQKLSQQYSMKDSVYNLSRSSLMTAAFAQKKWDLLRTASKDKFHQTARMERFPLLFSIQKLALHHGALMSVLSGSGSSFISVCHQDDCARIFHVMRDHFPKFVILNLAFDNDGLRVEG